MGSEGDFSSLLLLCCFFVVGVRSDGDRNGLEPGITRPLPSGKVGNHVPIINNENVQTLLISIEKGETKEKKKKKKELNKKKKRKGLDFNFCLELDIFYSLSPAREMSPTLTFNGGNAVLSSQETPRTFVPPPVTVPKPWIVEKMRVPWRARPVHPSTHGRRFGLVCVLWRFGVCLSGLASSLSSTRLLKRSSTFSVTSIFGASTLGVGMRFLGMLTDLRDSTLGSSDTEMKTRGRDGEGGSRETRCAEREETVVRLIPRTELRAELRTEQNAHDLRYE